VRIDAQTVQLAFKQRDEIYAQGRGWTSEDFCRLWRYGERAFSGAGDRTSFSELHSVLRKYWQVFRGPLAIAPDPAYAFELLIRVSSRFPDLRQLCLSQVSTRHTPRVIQVLTDASAIKQNKYGPSLVAATKFLHFWNPRLFVIVDDAVMAGYVLKHQWIQKEIRTVQAGLGQELVGQLGSSPVVQAGGGLSYPAILFWAGEVIRENPVIMEAFAANLRACVAQETLPIDYQTFEAAAFEWMLLGLVELPPSGVS
jgi:hypothetical protein